MRAYRSFSNIAQKDVAWFAASSALFQDADEGYAPVDAGSDIELPEEFETNDEDCPKVNREKRRGRRSPRSKKYRSTMGTSLNSNLAGAKALHILMTIEEQGSLACGPNSYGAAIAIPQIARSVGWSWTMVGLSLQTYVYLLLNYLLQGFVLCMVGLEMHFMFPFGGQMHLCDYGANIPECPNGPNCKGPGGSSFTYPRLYNFQTWSIRTFVRDALEAVVPEQIGRITERVDPGEYGLENYWIRALCVGFFIMSTLPDLENNIELARMHYSLPTRAESWILYEAPDAKVDVKKSLGKTELDFVIFRIAGMPLPWKLFNVLAIVLPKCLIWLVMARSGVHYLMETAGIIEVIVNSLAFSFVLSIDEMLFQHLANHTTQHMMSNLQSFPLFDIVSAETESDEIALTNYQDEELAYARWTQAVKAFMPWQLIKVVFLQCLFTGFYYIRNCERTEEGSWVSKPIATPVDLEVSAWSLIFGDVQTESEPVWSMPK